jgi:hypothetical protein
MVSENTTDLSSKKIAVIALFITDINFNTM